MSEDTEVADILLVTSGALGNPLVNIGEQSTGDGFGADTAVWANGDGFVSVPNPPDDAGCAQAMVQQDGNVKRVVASVDNRYVNKAGGPLAIGDKAIVSNCDAWFRLTRGSNKLELRSGAMTVTLDGDTGVVTIDGAGTVRIGESADLVHIATGSDLVTPAAAIGRVVRYGDLVSIPVVGGTIATGVVVAGPTPPLLTVPVSRVKA